MTSFGPENVTAKQELEGRILKLGKDRDAALADVRHHERSAEVRTQDAAEYQRLIDEYTAILNPGKDRTVKVTVSANVDGYLESMKQAKAATDAFNKARKEGGN